MIIKSAARMPSGNDYCDQQELDEYDVKELESSAITDAYYWYGSAPYEGSGCMVYRTKDGLWGVHYMGHCSCYGPLDHLETSKAKHESAHALWESCTDEMKHDLEPLAELFDFSTGVAS